MAAVGQTGGCLQHHVRLLHAYEMATKPQLVQETDRIWGQTIRQQYMSATHVLKY